MRIAFVTKLEVRYAQFNIYYISDNLIFGMFISNIDIRV